jgi:hypothetical protein
MVPRWALRFWPDTRSMVDDLVGLSPSNHGTLDAIPACAQSCAPAFWQQRSNAAFIAALNSAQETFPGISYTSIYTDTDEVVVPNFGPAASSSLSGGGGAVTNVAIQSVCPNDLTEHLGIGIYDNTAYLLALDALSHPGPADPRASRRPPAWTRSCRESIRAPSPPSTPTRWRRSPPRWRRPRKPRPSRPWPAT